MKNKFYILLTLFLSIFIISCDNNDEDIIPLGRLNVEIQFPEGYSDISKADIVVNLFESSKSTILLSATTNSDGFVVFEDLTLGDYTIKANTKLSAEQAITVTGINEEIELSSISTNNTIINNSDIDVLLQFKASEVGGLMIKEFYFGYAMNDNWEMRTDATFLDIYNNSNHTINLDGLYIGFSTGDLYLDRWTADSENSYLSQIFQIPGSGSDNPLEPGNSIVIARTAINHIDGGGLSDELKEAWTLEGVVNESADLSNADFEIFIDGKDDITTDFDVRNVPNLINAWQSKSFNDLAVTGQGVSIVLFRYDNDIKSGLETEEYVFISPRNARTTYNFKKLPVKQTIDALEIQNTRCFPETLVGSPLLPITENFMAFTAKSYRRKVAKTINGMRILLDTNNNLLDFEIIEHSTPKAWN